jgi:hypothetical protein
MLNLKTELESFFVLEGQEDESKIEIWLSYLDSAYGLKGYWLLTEKISVETKLNQYPNSIWTETHSFSGPVEEYIVYIKRQEKLFNYFLDSINNDYLNRVNLKSHSVN